MQYNDINMQIWLSMPDFSVNLHSGYSIHSVCHYTAEDNSFFINNNEDALPLTANIFSGIL